MNSLFATSCQRMNQLIRNVIALDVSVNLSLVIAVIAQRVKNLGKCDMR
jgi:hypothetical protein